MTKSYFPNHWVFAISVSVKQRLYLLSWSGEVSRSLLKALLQGRGGKGLQEGVEARATKGMFMLAHATCILPRQ